MPTVWTPKDYTDFFLLDEPTHTPKEIRAEYSRQRDIIRKRANRLREKGYEQQAEYLMKSMPKLSDLGQNNVTVAKRLAQGKALSRQRAYSVSGIKELQKMLKDETGELIPLGDVLPFADFMKSWRLSAFKEIVGSPQAAELYPYEYQEIGGSFSDFYTLYMQMQH